MTRRSDLAMAFVEEGLMIPTLLRNDIELVLYKMGWQAEREMMIRAI
jgi:hypothetical protein